MTTLQNIQKLKASSPSALVHFVAGSLPLTAILHIRQISLLGMISRLPQDPLHRLARKALLTSPSLSWFTSVRDLMQLYQLPHPLTILDYPPTKDIFKKLVKAKILDYWEKKLRAEAALLPSLNYFNPHFMSLSRPHKLWTTAGNNPFEVAKARVQLLFLSNQYPCAKVSRHWSAENPQGLCTYPLCHTKRLIESREHILLYCPAYNKVRQRMVTTCLESDNLSVKILLTKYLVSSNPELTMQFLVDCSVLSEVIQASQKSGPHIFSDLFYYTRTWCFVIHKQRMIRLCKWNFY